MSDFSLDAPLRCGVALDLRSADVRLDDGLLRDDGIELSVTRERRADRGG